MRRKGIWINTLCRHSLLLPSCFPYPAEEVSPPTFLGLTVYSQRSCEPANCLLELFLPWNSGFPYPTVGKHRTTFLHLQARTSSMQVRILLLSCQPWVILYLLHRLAAGSGEALRLRQSWAQLGNGTGACVSSEYSWQWLWATASAVAASGLCGASFVFLAAAVQTKPSLVLSLQ